MRRLLVVAGVAVSILALAACKVSDTGSGGGQSPQSQGQSTQQVAAQGTPAAGQPGQGGPNAPGFPTIDPTAAAAFQDVNRLAVGMLALQDANTHPLTKDEATKLLPLWQDVQSAMRPPQTTGTPQPPAQDQNQTPGGPNFPGGRRGGFFFGNAAQIETDVTSIRAALTQDQISDINGLTQDEMTATLQKHNINFGFGFGGPGGGGRNGRGNGGGNGGNGPGGFFGTPGAAQTARAEGTTFPGRPTPDANQLATIQARPTLSPDDLATAQARRNAGNPVIAAVIAELTTLANG